MGDWLFAAKPVPQFAPFFRLVRNLPDEDADAVEEVGQMSKKLAQDLDGIEDTGRLSRQLREVQTGGPDGTWITNKQVAQAA